jgi:hypothetical protein
MSVEEPGIGLMIIFCVIQFIVGNLIIFLMETKPFSGIRCCKTNKKISNDLSMLDMNGIEEDVATEIARIEKSDLKEQSCIEPLIVNGLTKRFHKGKTEFLAVNNLSFGISPKECFGYI